MLSDREVMTKCPKSKHQTDFDYPRHESVNYRNNATNSAEIYLWIGFFVVFIRKHSLYCAPQNESKSKKLKK